MKISSDIMKVSELISFLQSLDADRNIFLVYDRMEFQSPDVDILSFKDIECFSLPDYLSKLPESEKPHVGDYYFDAY